MNNNCNLEDIVDFFKIRIFDKSCLTEKDNQ